MLRKILTRVTEGVQFKDGIEVESDNQVAAWLNSLNTRFDNSSYLIVPEIKCLV